MTLRAFIHVIADVIVIAAVSVLGLPFFLALIIPFTARLMEMVGAID